VIGTGGGAAARTGEANTEPSASAAEPLRASRRESFGLFIARSSKFIG
jgi:hypothetical protein